MSFACLNPKINIMKYYSKILLSLLLLLVVNLSYSQDNAIEDEIEDLQQQLDENATAADSMDNVALQLDQSSNELESQLDDVGEKVEAAELDLEQKNEKSSWARLMKFGILAIAITAIFLIFRGKRKK